MSGWVGGWVAGWVDEQSRDGRMDVWTGSVARWVDGWMCVGYILVSYRDRYEYASVLFRLPVHR